MDGETLSCFSTLMDNVRDAMEETAFTCHYLNRHCSEYKKLLKRWCVAEQEVPECSCNPCFEEPEELVSDVIQVVEKAKATRGINIKKSVKTSNSSDYASDCRSVASKERHSHAKLVDKRKVSTEMRNIAEKKGSNSSASKTIICPRPRKMYAFQTTYQKDFSFKKVAFKPQINVKSNKTTTKFSNPSCVLSERSVEYLLKHVTSNTSQTSSKAPYNKVTEKKSVTNTICRLHTPGNSIPVYKSLKEAIYISGVPSDLLKLLLTLYRFIDSNNLNKSFKRETGTSYLRKLNETNEKLWNLSSSEPIVNLFWQYITEFVNVLFGKETNMYVDNFVELEEKLVSLGKTYLKVFDMDLSPRDHAAHVKKKSDKENLDRNMKNQKALAAFWREDFAIPGMESSLSISYKSRVDCKVLQKNIQKIQKLKLQIEVLKTLQNNVFPVLGSMDDGHVALPRLYRTCTALCDILSLPVPVILKL